MKCDCNNCAFRGMELCEQRKLMEENAKLREALKGVVNIANSRIPTVPTDGEFEIMRDAKEIMKGGAK